MTFTICFCSWVQGTFDEWFQHSSVLKDIILLHFQTILKTANRIGVDIVQRCFPKPQDFQTILAISHPPNDGKPLQFHSKVQHACMHVCMYARTHACMHDVCTYRENFR